MKRFGKQERKPEEASAQRPEVKSVLLQTYFTSLLSLLLCVTMFFGTSYAWFTSEVNNAGNEIYIGILDVEMEKQVPDVDNDGKEPDYVSLSAKNDEGNNTNKLFDGNIRWEPGYTTLETIRIVNEGDLAFHYVLNFTDGSDDTATADTEMDEGKLDIAKVAKYFDVWVYAHENEEAPVLESYADITEENRWKNAGTLDTLLAGEPVLEGTMEKVRVSNQAADAINEGTTDGHAASATYTIALHMSDDAGAEVMGQKITLNVKLVAYQMTSEEDGFGNSGYDSEITPVSNLAGLKTALDSNSKILLTTDVEIEKETDRVSMTGGILDGNGNTIVYSGEKNASGNSAGVVTTSGGTVRNLTIEGGENGRALYVTELRSDLVVSNCTLSGAYAFNLNSSKATKHTMTFTDTTFESWTSYANVMEHAYFTGCTFKATLRPYGDTTLTNCVFENGTLDLSALADGETVTLVNCTYKDDEGINAVLESNDDWIKVESENSVLTVSDGEMVVLNHNNG